MHSVLPGTRTCSYNSFKMTLICFLPMPGRHGRSAAPITMRRLYGCFPAGVKVLGQPINFKEIYRSSVPTWANHWRYNWDTDVVLDRAADQVYVKYTGNPGLNAVRACLHLFPKHAPQSKVRIIHGYQNDRQLHREIINLDKPGSYTVECNGEPENVFIKISVPSQ